MQEKTSITDKTVQQIISYIAENGLRDGTRIPNERDLAELFNVGRSTLREAIKKLESLNVLEVRRGVGAFVSYKHGVADDPLGLSLIRDKQQLARDMLEFRILIEPRTAALAALYATDDDIVELEYLCDSVDELILSDKNHIAKDMEYHTKIARCSSNIIMPKLLPIIHSGIDLFIAQTHRRLRDETMKTHRAVLEAIKHHDPIKASDSMMLHLIYNRDMMEDIKGQFLRQTPAAP
jgi:DNA-binding FadR family transcriptional regulator